MESRTTEFNGEREREYDRDRERDRPRGGGDLERECLGRRISWHTAIFVPYPRLVLLCFEFFQVSKVYHIQKIGKPHRHTIYTINTHTNRWSSF